MSYDPPLCCELCHEVDCECEGVTAHKERERERRAKAVAEEQVRRREFLLDHAARVAVHIANVTRFAFAGYPG